MKNIFKDISHLNQFDHFFDLMSEYISKNDTIYVELDLMNFATIDSNSISRSEFLNFFLKLFSELVGEKGNLIVPTFSYSWGENNKEKIYDVVNTRALTGIFPNFLLGQKNTIRTMDPIFSTAVIGHDSKYFIQNNNNSFSSNSIFKKIYDTDAKLISFGLNKFDPTFVHFVEQYFDETYEKINYRYLKKLNGTMIDYNNNLTKNTFLCFLRDMKKDMSFNEIKIKNDLKAQGLYTNFKIFNGNVHLCRAVDFFNVGVAGMKKNPYYFVK